VRVSEKFGLGVTQASLDFVDVDILGDVPVFIDPKAIRLQSGEWAETCQALLQSFFEELLAAIKDGNKERVAELVLHLDEPNETHLGVSKGEARGRGLGNGKRSREVVDALANSVAGKTGLLQDLEETVLFVTGIGRDIVSDITTNIIRGPLIAYTQNMCAFYNITMVKQTSGFMWDPETRTWVDNMVELPRAASDKLILVPRSIVRLSSITDQGKYYRGFIRPYFEDIELNDPSSQLIKTLKDGRKKVQLTELDELIDQTKPGLVEHTQRWPDALARYRTSVTATTNPPLNHDDFEYALGAEVVDYRALMDSVRAIAPGSAGATSYHRAVEELLTALFDASLGNVELEVPIHAGRKRLDIRYDNVAGSGFFHWLGQHYHAATVVVECKNYKADPKNPELDQLGGRFSPKRGQVGILVCRTIKKKSTFLERCRDTAGDDRGYIIALDDSDLEDLVDAAERLRDEPFAKRAAFPLLRQRFMALIG
jgi:hypothetical protein